MSDAIFGDLLTFLNLPLVLPFDLAVLAVLRNTGNNPFWVGFGLKQRNFRPKSPIQARGF